jgi:hypothetical protein
VLLTFVYLDQPFLAKHAASLSQIMAMQLPLASLLFHVLTILAISPFQRGSSLPGSLPFWS